MPHNLLSMRKRKKNLIHDCKNDHKNILDTYSKFLYALHGEIIDVYMSSLYGSYKILLAGIQDIYAEITDPVVKNNIKKLLEKIDEYGEKYSG
jgi:Icc-related predicted phosphoesterase